MPPFVYEVPMLEFIFKKSVAGFNLNNQLIRGWIISLEYHKSEFDSFIWPVSKYSDPFSASDFGFVCWVILGMGHHEMNTLFVVGTDLGSFFPTIKSNRRLLKCLIIVNPDEQIPSNSFPRCGGIKPKPRTPQGGFALPFSLLPVSSCVVLQTSPNLPSLSLAEFGCFFSHELCVMMIHASCRGMVIQNVVDSPSFTGTRYTGIP